MKVTSGICPERLKGDENLRIFGVPSEIRKGKEIF
jgi:hypothetical protein